MRLIKSLVIVAASSVMLLGCSANGDNPGVEYAPNMYHSVAYDPLTQITDKDAGSWLTSIEYPDGHAEFFNSNVLNPHHMNMREPAPHTVKRNNEGWLPYRIPKDSLELASRTLVNPIDSSAAITGQGKVLYEMYCDHCHGPTGAGDGLVAVGAEVAGVKKGNYNGVPDYNSAGLKNITEGHIFHVITHGKGLMWAHGSQVSPEDRWKIARYVKTLQK